jgi:hypothetical protein
LASTWADGTPMEVRASAMNRLTSTEGANRIAIRSPICFLISLANVSM